MAITLPTEYGWVLLAATSTFFVNTFHGILTGKYRKASGVKYPAAYAANEVAEKDPKAFTFNCAQRAHANYTENLTPALLALFVAGLRHPLIAASVFTSWSVARIGYARGYTAYGPSGRSKFSIFASLVDLSLKLLAIYGTVQFVLEK
ncbi:hypothetical protein B0T25DRAFT_109675 [Lasiosphaeria hispida]|uniref:Microsomal glutathione S-transferase 3 n=1 Tax=Lasiosphaeria hispida TaxID=260671 RepID=A0AAJ0HQU6_9PEZI|nr:hypothetical protein B0T25DRAFT_109675 [Lasiosphaeria hispida]